MMEFYMGEMYYDDSDDDECKEKICPICNRPIQNHNDVVHPDCELKASIQAMQHRTRFDGTGQDEDEMI